ncbi:MAG: hypothetical protein ACWGSD_10060, partial [Thermodesulfobacteriota bacterium]
GTTLLHRLLSEDPAFRSPFAYEMEKAVPPLRKGEDPLADPRIRKNRATMGAISIFAPGFLEKLAESHYWSATEKERQVEACRSKRDFEMSCLQQLQRAAHS